MYRSEYFASRAEANWFIRTLIDEAISHIVYYPAQGIVEVRYSYASVTT